MANQPFKQTSSFSADATLPKKMDKKAQTAMAPMPSEAAFTPGIAAASRAQMRPTQTMPGMPGAQAPAPSPVPTPTMPTLPGAQAGLPRVGAAVQGFQGVNPASVANRLPAEMVYPTMWQSGVNTTGAPIETTQQTQQGPPAEYYNPGGAYEQAIGAGYPMQQSQQAQGTAGGGQTGSAFDSLQEQVEAQVAGLGISEEDMNAEIADTQYKMQQQFELAQRDLANQMNRSGMFGSSNYDMSLQAMMAQQAQAVAEVPIAVRQAYRQQQIEMAMKVIDSLIATAQGQDLYVLQQLQLQYQDEWNQNENYLTAWANATNLAMEKGWIKNPASLSSPMMATVLESQGYNPQDWS